MNSRAAGRNVSGRNKGFTLIEMMIVISVILILLGIAMPVYSHSVRRAREENLRKNLETLNKLIFQYALDKQKAPQSLDDLRTEKYLTDIPDDITGSNTWETEPADAYLSLDQIASMTLTMSLNQGDQKDKGDEGIIGVHSGSNEIGSNGKPYSDW